MTAEANRELQLTIDKFVFRFPGDVRYSEAGMWVRREGHLLRLGLSDFLQQRSGDIAFATIAEEGIVLDAGDEIASIETVKVNFSLPSPLRGKILETNADLKESPEFMNQDPYGRGWIAVLQPEDPEWSMETLLTADAYCKLAGQQAEAELRSH